MSQNNKTEKFLNIKGLRFECGFSSYPVFRIADLNDNQQSAQYTSHAQ